MNDMFTDWPAADKVVGDFVRKNFKLFVSKIPHKDLYGVTNNIEIRFLDFTDIFFKTITATAKGTIINAHINFVRFFKDKMDISARIDELYKFNLNDDDNYATVLKNLLFTHIDTYELKENRYFIDIFLEDYLNIAPAEIPCETNSSCYMAENLLTFVNNIDCNKKAFVNTVIASNPATQQALFALMLDCIEEWAKYAGLVGTPIELTDTCALSKNMHDANIFDWKVRIP